MHEKCTYFLQKYLFFSLLPKFLINFVGKHIINHYYINYENHYYKYSATIPCSIRNDLRQHERQETETGLHQSLQQQEAHEESTGMG